MGHEELILIVIQRTIKLLGKTKLLWLKQKYYTCSMFFFSPYALVQGGKKMEE